MQYILMWAEKTSLQNIEFFSQSFIKFRSLPWNKVNDSIIYLKDSQILEAWISDLDYQRLKKLHGDYFFLKRERLQRLLNEYQRLEKVFYQFADKVNRFDFSKITQRELYQLYTEYCDIELRITAWFRGTRPEAEGRIVAFLQRQLDNITGSPEQTQAYFNLLT